MNCSDRINVAGEHCMLGCHRRHVNWWCGLLSIKCHNKNYVLKAAVNKYRCMLYKAPDLAVRACFG